MSQKNLNVSNKTHRLLLDKLKDKRILKLYKNFDKSFNIEEDFIVAVSGGPDSLALSFLSKLYAIKKSLNARFFIVDHKLRKGSSSEAIYVKKKLKKYLIHLNILTWSGKKPKNNIQSIARKNRFKLLINESKKLKINNILLGHHLDDLFENFFLRILRGSGLNGLISFDKKTQLNNINLIRPLINFDKKDLIYISKKFFGSFVDDPSNDDYKFKRVKIRNLLKNLKDEGLDKNKFFLTIKNLKFANETIKIYTKKNLAENTFFFEKKFSMILKENFFLHSNEVVFRSFTEIIKFIGKKFYPTRGKKIDKVIDLIRAESSFKTTLGGCIIKKVNKSVIVSKE